MVLPIIVVIKELGIFRSWPMKEFFVCHEKKRNRFSLLFSIMTHERVFWLTRKKQIQSLHIVIEREKEIPCRLLSRRHRYVSCIDILWLIITSLFFSYFLFNFELDNECLFVCLFYITAVIVNPPIVGGQFLLQSFFSGYNSQRPLAASTILRAII